MSTENKPGDPLSEAVESLARRLYEDGTSQPLGAWPPKPGHSGTDYAEAFRDRARSYLADPVLASHYEQKGAEGERAKLEPVIEAARIFLHCSEEIERSGEYGPMSQYEDSWHDLQDALAALSQKETDQPGEESP